jgi:hypothetical protein
MVQTHSNKKFWPSKLALGIVTAAVVSLGTVGAVSANHGGTAPADKQLCKNGGYSAYGFANQGQCIKAVNDNNNHHGDDHNNGGGNDGDNGNGYGGGHNVDLDVNVDVSGDRNIVNVIFHFIFG